jgi:hypothetical protein
MLAIRRESVVVVSFLCVHIRRLTGFDMTHPLQSIIGVLVSAQSMFLQVPGLSAGIYVVAFLFFLFARIPSHIGNRVLFIVEQLQCFASERLKWAPLTEDQQRRLQSQVMELQDTIFKDVPQQEHGDIMKDFEDHIAGSGCSVVLTCLFEGTRSQVLMNEYCIFL